MILKNRKFISKIKRSKVTDYAAFNVTVNVNNRFFLGVLECREPDPWPRSHRFEFNSWRGVVLLGRILIVTAFNTGKYYVMTDKLLTGVSFINSNTS